MHNGQINSISYHSQLPCDKPSRSRSHGFMGQNNSSILVIRTAEDIWSLGPWQRPDPWGTGRFLQLWQGSDIWKMRLILTSVPEKWPVGQWQRFLLLCQRSNQWDSGRWLRYDQWYNGRDPYFYYCRDLSDHWNCGNLWQRPDLWDEDTANSCGKDVSARTMIGISLFVSTNFRVNSKRSLETWVAYLCISVL